MATPSCINIDQTTAVVEWQWEGATRTLAAADPDYAAIQFTLQLDLSEHDSQSYAHFEISIPFRFKDKPTGATVCLRINPFFIKSFKYSTLSKPSDAVKLKFNSTTYLDLELDQTITVLVPSYVQEPVGVARALSGVVLDAIYELSCVTSLRIYIQESLLSLDKLKFISEAVEHRRIKPSSNSSHDISCMFSGAGGKVATIAPPKPPSYERATKLPRGAASNRKRPRQDNQPDIFTQLWDKLNKLESKVGELQADNAQLKSKVGELQVDNAQLKSKVGELQVDNAQLKDELTRLEKTYGGLEAQVALSLANGNDTEEATIIDIQDDIDSLNDRVASIEDGRDEDFSQRLKGEIFDELAKRLLSG